MQVPTQAILGTRDNQHCDEFTYLDADETKLVETREPQYQLYFALLLTHYRRNLNFHFDPSLILPLASLGLSNRLNVPNVLHIPSQRSLTEYRRQLRHYFKMAAPTTCDYKQVQVWLVQQILPTQALTLDELKVQVEKYLREKKIEFFKEKTLQRILQAALNEYEIQLFDRVASTLTLEAKAYLDGLMLKKPAHHGLSYFGWLGLSYNKPSLDTLLMLLQQIDFLAPLCAQITCLDNVPRKRFLRYTAAIARHNPNNVKVLPDTERYARLAIYALARYQAIIDQAIDMFSRLSRNVIHKSERKVIKSLIKNVKVVFGKEKILCDLAEICLANPNSKINEVIFPVFSEKKLENIIKDIKKKGPKYQTALHDKIKSSYANYYRRMTKPFLTSLTFRYTNPSHKPLLEGLQLIRDYFDSNTTYFPKRITIPIDFIPKKWQDRIIDPDSQRIKRTAYEVYVLKRLGDLLQCREIWVESAFKYRNPDKDIPEEFNTNHTIPYDRLNLNQDANIFINELQSMHRQALSEFHQQISHNENVSLSDKKGGRIILTPLEAQEESPHLHAIKKQVMARWPHTNLLDALKEVELRLGLTKHFISYGEKIYLKPRELSLRLLLAVYGFGTNTGMKTMCASNHGISYKSVQHIKEYFLTESNLRDAIGRIVNALFHIRNPEIWGEMPIAVASDSTQFSAYFQNLISEYHNRYGGRGVMIYWHVEKNATCIFSQIKSVSSSEVSAMIKGALNHCADMSVKKNYVDTHGQSEVGFAFSFLLGFMLMPRFANLSRQKLYQCELGDYQRYTNLQEILTDTIKWDSIKIEYPQMVKYAAAMKERYADPESLLKRFNRNNLSHPTYQALSQLGKVIKTIYLCNFLMSTAIQREVQEGLNVVELWNGVSKFIFYGRSGEIASNNPNDHVLSMLCLHLLQISMVYVNTLMLQEIIIENNWLCKLTPEDKRALSPLIYGHINPYGLFPLDWEKRIQFINYYQKAA